MMFSYHVVRTDAVLVWNDDVHKVSWVWTGDKSLEGWQGDVIVSKFPLSAPTIEAALDGIRKIAEGKAEVAVQNLRRFFALDI